MTITVRPDPFTLIEYDAKEIAAIIEDCAQSHGAKWRGKRAGSFTEHAAFSFYPSKNLTVYGDVSQTRSFLPSAVPRRSVETRSGPAFL